MLYNPHEKFEPSKKGKDPKYNGTNLSNTGNPLKNADGLFVTARSTSASSQKSSLSIETKPTKNIDAEPRYLDPEFTGKGGTLYKIV